MAGLGGANLEQRFEKGPCGERARPAAFTLWAYTKGKGKGKTESQILRLLSRYAWLHPEPRSKTKGEGGGV